MEAAVNNVSDTLYGSRLSEHQKVNGRTRHLTIRLLLCWRRTRTSYSKGLFSPGNVAWGMVVRTSAIDRLIYEALSDGSTPF